MRSTLLPALRRLLSLPSAAIGLGLLAIILGLIVFAPLISGDPQIIDPANRLEAPTSGHPLGTDDQGRDLWTILLYGGQTAFSISAVCTALALVAGFIIGICCGYFSSFDLVMSRVIDGLMAFPNIILVMSFVGVLGSGVTPVVVGLTIVLIPPIARVVRAAALKMRSLPMVESARTIGAGHLWILRKYVAPESTSVVVVQATMGFVQTILSIAALSFLGIGLPPEVPSWGTTLSVAQQYIGVAWWLAVFPGVAILISVLALILIGDGLRDLLDPQTARRRGFSVRRRPTSKAACESSPMVQGATTETVTGRKP